MLWLLQRVESEWDADMWSSFDKWTSVYVCESHREAKRRLHHAVNSQPTWVCLWNGEEKLAKGRANAKYWRIVPLKPGPWPVAD